MAAKDNPDYFDLAGQVLDHMIVDSEDMPCGKVDDIEIEGDLGGPLRVKALHVGPGAWMPRLPALLALIAGKFFRRSTVAVAWEQVEEITPTIKLRSTAAELGLGKADRKAARFMRKVLRS
jgi:hypothetical protein